MACRVLEGRLRRGGYERVGWVEGGESVDGLWGWGAM